MPENFVLDCSCTERSESRLNADINNQWIMEVVTDGKRWVSGVDSLYRAGIINPNRPQSNKIQQGEVKKMR